MASAERLGRCAQLDGDPVSVLEDARDELVTLDEAGVDQQEMAGSVAHHVARTRIEAAEEGHNSRDTAAIRGGEDTSPVASGGRSAFTVGDAVALVSLSLRPR